MKTDKLDAGQLVRSMIGRDAGKLYLIWGYAEKNRFLVVDGRTREAEKPKKKNIKHLQILPCRAEKIKEKLQEGKRVSNEDLRAAIAEIGEKYQSGV